MSVFQGARPTLPLEDAGRNSIVYITDISVTGAENVNGIYWVPKDQDFEITGTIDLPDLRVMVIFEKVLDAKTVISDVRAIAQITEKRLSIRLHFPESGNYIITPERLNRGLARIKALFRLSFDAIEFDSHIVPKSGEQSA